MPAPDALPYHCPQHPDGPPVRAEGRDDVSTRFDELLETMRRLRDPDSGCPWDLQQTHASLRDSLLEETYELLDALGSGETGPLVEELGDVLLHVVFHAQIGADEREFGIDDVIAQVNAKLVRRHPHVFADASARTPEEVKGQWERVKAQERADRGRAADSMLDGVSRSMPALAYAEAALTRARQAGFDWDDPAMSFEKVAEEVRELREAESPQRREEEFGDLLFALVGAAHRMEIDAEQALRGANARFRERLGRVERAAREEAGAIADLATARKLELWEQAKAAEGE